MILFAEPGGMDPIALIDKLGFPIAIALFGLFFAYKVWGYMTKKLDEQGSLVKQQIDHQQEFSGHIVATQNKISDSFERHEDILKTMRDSIERIGK